MTDTKLAEKIALAAIQKGPILVVYGTKDRLLYCGPRDLYKALSVPLEAYRRDIPPRPKDRHSGQTITVVELQARYFRPPMTDRPWHPLEEEEQPL